MDRAPVAIAARTMSSGEASSCGVGFSRALEISRFWQNTAAGIAACHGKTGTGGGRPGYWLPPVGDASPGAPSIAETSRSSAGAPGGRAFRRIASRGQTSHWCARPQAGAIPAGNTFQLFDTGRQVCPCAALEGNAAPCSLTAQHPAHGRQPCGLILPRIGRNHRPNRHRPPWGCTLEGAGGNMQHHRAPHAGYVPPAPRLPRLSREHAPSRGGLSRAPRSLSALRIIYRSAAWPLLPGFSISSPWR